MSFIGKSLINILDIFKEKSKKKIAYLKRMADVLRIDSLDMVYSAKSGHLGGSFSLAEFMSALYFKNFEFKDRVILSKGHASPIYYSAMIEKKILSRDNIEKFRSLNGLSGHPSNNDSKLIPISTGSLGQGLSVANGFCMGDKIDKNDILTFCILGDGELEEGSNWEALMTSHKLNLNNLIIVIDNNKLQIDGNILEVKKLDNIDKKIESFGIEVRRIDGHNVNKILKALDYAKERLKYSHNPYCIILDTIKGKGVSFMENNYLWHGKAPNKEEYILARKEILKRLEN